MYTAIMVIHLIVCFFMIFLILVQSSKGAEMGAAFGGSSQTLFGSRGASTFMSKLTTASAIIFMITSLSLAIISANRGSVMSSVSIQEAPVNPISNTAGGPIQEQPAAPGQGEVNETPAVPAAPSEKAQ